MKRIILFLAIAAVLITGSWFAWDTFSKSPQEQVLAAQERFLRALEDRDWSEVKSMLTNDYADDYGQDRETAVENGRQVLAGFYTITIKEELTKLQAAPDLGMVMMKIKIEGNGSGLSQIVLSQVNQMQEPWYFHWHKKGRWPWDWKIVQIHHNQLQAGQLP